MTWLRKGLSLFEPRDRQLESDAPSDVLSGSCVYSMCVCHWDLTVVGSEVLSDVVCVVIDARL